MLRTSCTWYVRSTLAGNRSREPGARLDGSRVALVCVAREQPTLQRRTKDELRSNEIFSTSTSMVCVRMLAPEYVQIHLPTGLCNEPATTTFGVLAAHLPHGMMNR